MYEEPGKFSPPCVPGTVWDDPLIQAEYDARCGYRVPTLAPVTVTAVSISPWLVLAGGILLALAFRKR